MWQTTNKPQKQSPPLKLTRLYNSHSPMIPKNMSPSLIFCFLNMSINLLLTDSRHKDLFMPYHGDGEGVDALDIQETVLPGDEALNVDVKLVPDGQDGVVVLLVSLDNAEIKIESVTRRKKDFLFS